MHRATVTVVKSNILCDFSNRMNDGAVIGVYYFQLYSRDGRIYHAVREWIGCACACACAAILFIYVFYLVREF